MLEVLILCLTSAPISSKSKSPTTVAVSSRIVASSCQFVNYRFVTCFRFLQSNFMPCNKILLLSVKVFFDPCTDLGGCFRHPSIQFFWCYNYGFFCLVFVRRRLSTCGLYLLLRVGIVFVTVRDCGLFRVRGGIFVCGLFRVRGGIFTFIGVMGLLCKPDKASCSGSESGRKITDVSLSVNVVSSVNNRWWRRGIVQFT